MGTRRAARSAAFGLLLLACADSAPRSANESGIDSGSSFAGDAAPQVPRVKERTVTIELPRVATRALEQGPDGELVYGPVLDLDGAEACVVQRRDAFAVFGPFEPLDPPLCDMTSAGETVVIEDVPAQSDLLITVEKEGFVPAVSTQRVEDYNAPLPIWGSQLVTLLLPAGAEEPWLEPPAGPSTGLSPISLQVVMVWAGQSASAGSNQLLGVDGVVSSWASAQEAQLTITRHGSGAEPPLTLTTLAARPSFLELEPGSYRVRVSHPRVRFEPCGARDNHFTAGLGTETRDELEVPVLEGHRSYVCGALWCVPLDEQQRLVDLATCTLDPP